MTASLSLPGIPPALADELRLDLARPSTTAVCVDAIAAYDRATTDWYAARDLGDITWPDPDNEDDARDLALGVRWKAATPTGARVLAAWQRARAELAHAVRVRRAEIAGRGR